TTFHQQRLPAWQPIVTARNVFPFFLIVGIIFVPLGAFLLVSSNQIVEKIVDYTHCLSVEDNRTMCSESVKNPSFVNKYQYCHCRIEISLEQDIPYPVYVYYGLTNFYQNHRRYVRSRDDNQLNGKFQESLTSDCDPYRYYQNSTMQFAPCGAIAMSIFNGWLHFFLSTYYPL
ncbi:unnamed protein product, partial [Protopolystoma xenopodis]